MVNGEGNARERFKTTIGLISNKAILHVQQIFFVHFFAVVFHDYNAKLPETSQFHLFGRKGHMCSSSLFFTATHFHLALVAASISPFVTTTTKFSCCYSNKKMSPFFYLSLQISAAFFLIELRWPAAYFVFFGGCLSLALYFKFVDLTINLSLILQTTWIQKQFPLSVFVFLDSLVVSALQNVGG